MDSSPPCPVICLPDIDIESQVSCARRRLVVIAPGLSESVALAALLVLVSGPEIAEVGIYASDWSVIKTHR